ncbi:hypothetical protein PHYSODRAFT_471877 [Phytophthora sojae]|uniref:Uncharacterized protein n=1 Tax=Phytophthora sojae (strain P6497) TaxID=1094619 RepID=G4YJ31_PHYSP|nr:hypothetical protein PHYSODRAFT_471877 [Phytophthora sojae]EGZ29171.1 hypothetical protein PHYSODRAFT_471877 [Phytophthora sojae]|eukprot:XP_009516446.1 hypothetical protein PHYSODRAFT_471877 [Phytophthora sojae]
MDDPAKPDKKSTDDVKRTGTWAAQYLAEKQQQNSTGTRSWKSVLHPSVIQAVLAVSGRCLIAPILLIIVCGITGYFSSATFFIEAKDSYFAYSQLDPVMHGGCTGCVCSCRKVLIQLSAFGTDAILSKPAYEDLQAIATEAVANNDYSRLTPAALALADQLDSDGAVSSGPDGILSVINTLGLSLPPQMRRELEVAVERKNECVSRWNIGVLLRLHKFQTVKGSSEYASVPVADINTFPHYTDCRPDIQNEGIIGEKLAYATDGEDLLAVTKATVYGYTTVTQPLFRSYYAGCRVRTVNTTGVYVEDTCTLLEHWRSYGLTLQAPDDLPVCSTGDVCVRNQYNSEWEYTNDLSSTDPTRLEQIISVFRSRYADTVELSVLPCMLVAQILLMGVISLYQVMSHKKSVILAQIWAYRCQNGRMQPIYLAQVTYHLAFNSNMYYLGLSTGTLSSASVLNLSLCFFAFAYSTVNLIKARSGEQVLDRDFRLPWEVILLTATVCVGAVIFSYRITSLAFIGDKNGQLLRRTSVLGAKYCGLQDSCYVFTYNLVFVVAAASLALGLLAAIITFLLKLYKKRNPGAKMYHYRVSNAGLPGAGEQLAKQRLTSFEENCLGVPFTRLFKDCDDFAYTMHIDKRCSTVEAVLLTGYLFYGENLYQASSVVLLLIARLLPRKVIRTFNQLFIRWYIEPELGTISYPMSCPWYIASAENYKLSDAIPLA